jgi:hypothetical protein
MLYTTCSEPSGGFATFSNVPPSFQDGVVRELGDANGDEWEHPQILGKFRGDVRVPCIGFPISKIIKIKIIMIKDQQ